MLIKPNQKLTIISISEMLQTTIKREVRLCDPVSGRATYKVRGKHKTYFLDISPDILVFDGWSLPISIDSDTHHIASNGCINFVSDRQQDLRDFIEQKNCNELFNRFDLIMYRKPFTTSPYFELF